MKKAILLLIIGGVSVLLIALGLQSWVVKKDEKDENAEKTKNARDAKALRKKLIPIAEENDIRHIGVSTASLQEQIDNLKKEDNGEYESEIESQISDSSEVQEPV